MDNFGRIVINVGGWAIIYLPTVFFLSWHSINCFWFIYSDLEISFLSLWKSSDRTTRPNKVALAYSDKIILHDYPLVPIIDTLECSICLFNAINISLPKTSGNKGIGFTWKIHKWIQYFSENDEALLPWEVLRGCRQRRQSWNLTLTFYKQPALWKKREKLVGSGENHRNQVTLGHIQLTNAVPGIKYQSSEGSIWHQ